MVQRRRRIKGTGSVYEDKATGTWRAALEVDDGAGRRKRVVRRAATKSGAETKLRQLRRDAEEGVSPGDDTTTETWLRWWVAEYLPASVSPRTAQKYAAGLRDHVYPHIGRIPLRNLRAEPIVIMMNRLEAQGLAPATRRFARSVLRRALRDAMLLGRIDANPAAVVPGPRGVRPKTSDRLTKDEAMAVLEVARGDRLEALAVLALYSGMRKGEMLALRWDDIDLPARRLHVRAAKTPNGVRTVALQPRVVAALTAHQAGQRRERIAARYWGDPGIVFASTIGTTIDPAEALRWWWRLCEEAGIGRRRMHAARHTAATLLLNQGGTIESVAKILGNTPAVAQGVYAEVLHQMQADTADLMTEVLG